STIGSKAMSGILDKSEIEDLKDDEGITVREAIESIGLDWNLIENAERDERELKSFLELHIEQGTRIENANADFGVVRGIACPIRRKIIFHGEANHSGTTRMQDRKDALVASAEMVSYIHEITNEINENE